MTYRLMIKIHNVTGLMYLCKTERRGWVTYTGSGTYWKRHLKKHGRDFDTQLLFKSDDAIEFKHMALHYSKLLDVVASDRWANMCHEEGTGGDTVGGRFWITDGITERYCVGEVPHGWRRGRCNCVFSNLDVQREMSGRMHAKYDAEFRSTYMKAAWAAGRFANRPNWRNRD